MESGLPRWYEDEDHPRYVVLGLEMRNELLYGPMRTLRQWRFNVEPDPRWTFSSDAGLHEQLRELWSLIAETHFVHVVLALLPDAENVRRLREIQAAQAEESAGHVAEALRALRAFAGRYPETEIQIEHFEIDWAEWWRTSANEESPEPQDELSAFKYRITEEAIDEMKHGTLCSVSADEVHQGMVVVTVGGEFDFEITVEVVSYDRDSRVAKCVNPATSEVHDVPLANLRNPNAIGGVILERIRTALGEEDSDAEARFQERKQAIMDEVLNEVQHGSRFAVSAEEVAIGMVVCCVGTELDPMEMAMVTSWDAPSQTAVCQAKSGQAVTAPVASLRNARAAIEEVEVRVGKVIQELGRGLPVDSVLIMGIRRKASPGMPPGNSAN